MSTVNIDQNFSHEETVFSIFAQLADLKQTPQIHKTSASKEPLPSFENAKGYVAVFQKIDPSSLLVQVDSKEVRSEKN